MSSCCQCNGSGRCVNCVCVKAGNACTNCMPQRHRNCRNTITNRSDLRDLSAVASQATVPVQPSPSPTPPQQVEIQSGVSLPPFIPMAQSTASTITSQLVSPTTPDTADVTTIPDLPPYPPLRDISLTMGAQDVAEFSHQLSEVYEEIIHFSPNLLEVPMGNTGQTFVGMLSTLFHAFGSDSLGSADYAMKAGMVMQQLLLQKPVGKLTFAASTECLQRRIASWNKGAVRELLRESTTMQHQLAEHRSRHRGQDGPTTDPARKFASNIKQGKLSAAIRQISPDQSVGKLDLDDVIGEETVREVLRSKHPPAEPASPVSLLQGQPPAQPHPVLFTSLDRTAIRRAALHTGGAAGPSGMDSDGWRRMCTAFEDASDDLCDAVACSARRIATSYINPAALESFVACRLIPLDKKPGVRPIGIGETVRRIIGNAILGVTGDSICEATDSLQLCGGEECGIETAIHAKHDIFGAEDVDAVLLVHASNAFNRLNREACMRNVADLCPAITSAIINCYRHPACLFVGGECLLSREGTTLGDPLAMPMYALGVLRLVGSVATPGARQCWYADGASAGGKLASVCKWWDRLVMDGPAYGYFTNPSKSVLVKPDRQEAAKAMFSGTGVTITTDAAATSDQHSVPSNSSESSWHPKSKPGHRSCATSPRSPAPSPRQPTLPWSMASNTCGPPFVVCFKSLRIILRPWRTSSITEYFQQSLAEWPPARLRVSS